MKILFRKADKLIRRLGPPKPAMIIRAGTHLAPPRFPRIRNFVHKIRRALVVAPLFVVTHAQSQHPLPQVVRHSGIYGTGTFTTTVSSPAFIATTSPLKNYALQVVQTGTVTSWDVRLEGSIDGTNFSQILQHTNTTGSGVVVFSGSNVSPSLYFRARVAGLVLGLGTNIVVSVLGTQ